MYADQQYDRRTPELRELSQVEMEMVDGGTYRLHDAKVTYYTSAPHEDWMEMISFSHGVDRP